jgi:hypothetical protein
VEFQGAQCLNSSLNKHLCYHASYNLGTGGDAKSGANKEGRTNDESEANNVEGLLS